MSIYSEIYNKVEYPVICTRGVIVFPNQDITVDVGRTKSVNAMRASQNKYDSLVWVVTQKDIMIDNPGEQDMYSFGTLCQIKSVREDKKLFKLKIHGLARAQANVIYDNADMFMANISVVDDISDDLAKENVLVHKVVESFENAASNLKAFPKEVISEFSNGVSSSALADQFGQYVPMSLANRQEILEAIVLSDRLLLILKQFEVAKQMKEVEDKINIAVKESVEENQKEYYLRERLKAIKEELGDNANSEDLMAVFENNPYPKHVKDKAKEEISRFEMMSPMSQESTVIRTYLDWLEKVPWWQQTTDRSDINEISKILDEDHYGLEKVKERVLEYIAVKQLTGTLNAPILCLYGPPGVGKTSLAKSIARALDRKFVKASLGGVHDEAEIRGHRRTYLGSQPGRIIQGMKKVGVINPVFLIDELDKMGSDYKGDPSSAMLEVLDPEQNTFFSDNYLEEPYDLSKVMFIATANDLSTIPGPLRDRLELIELSSYTEEDKLHIAKEHLITKQLNANGLKKSQFKIGDEEILYIIRNYSREAGVRQLERLIGKLCRKTALEITKGTKKSVKVSIKLIESWLGKEIYEYGKKENSDQVGVVTGLAYTQFGGDVLPVEVTYFAGKGGLIITGNLGDVMKESASIAFGYVKANAQKYGIDPKFFAEHDIHIHVPEGAVPKDGPSAGVALTTAIVSALTGTKVSSSVAMTGEVTLRGNVLPIGGLREKSMAAYRSEIRTVIIPKNNEKDIDDIPEAVRSAMKFIPVSHVDDVLKVALKRN